MDTGDLSKNMVPQTRGNFTDSPGLFHTNSSMSHETENLSVRMDRVEVGNWGNLVPVKYGKCTAGAGEGQDKWTQMAKLIAVALVPVIVLIIQNAITLSEMSTRVTQTAFIKENILFSIETANVVHAAQLERGTTALYVGSSGDPGVYESLQEKYNDTDAVILSLTKWPSVSGVPDYFQTRDSFHQRIKDFRANVDPNNITVREVVDFYSADIHTIISWLADSIKFSKDNDLWQTLVSYHMLILSKEEAGVERALGSTFYAKDGGSGTVPSQEGGFRQDELYWYMQKRIQGFAYLEQSEEYAPEVKVAIDREYRGSSTFDTLKRMRNEIENNNLTSLSVQAGTWWFDNMTIYINILKDIQDTFAQTIVQRLDDEVDGLQNKLTITIILLVVSVLLSPIIIFGVFRLTNQIQQFAHSLRAKTQDLETERKRTEGLLNEMLPASVARSLVSKQTVPPESYESVTIFFSDIVSFTAISSRCTPLEVVSLLSYLYETFDDRLELYDVYKVETIGDGYMVASGLPQRNGDRHAVEIASLSLDLLETISDLVIPILPDQRLRLRVGINSGPVVAGIVGTKMPRYCLFGDTVNTASRMESSSEPMRIQISASTKDYLEKFGGFSISERGFITIKGKGVMQTFWLNGKNMGSNKREVVELTAPILHS